MIMHVRVYSYLSFCQMSFKLYIYAILNALNAELKLKVV